MTPRASDPLAAVRAAVAALEQARGEAQDKVVAARSKAAAARAAMPTRPEVEDMARRIVGELAGWIDLAPLSSADPLRLARPGRRWPASAIARSIAASSAWCSPAA